MRGVYKFVISGVLALVVVIGVLLFVWNWDWFVPFANREASAALSRPVTIRHLHLSLARNPIIEADGVVVGNPPQFPADATPLIRIDRLGVTLDGMAWLLHRTVGLLEINLIRPVIEARALPDGANNWTLGSGSGSGSGTQQAAGGARPTFGALHIEDGRVHAIDPRLKADFVIDIATRDAPASASPAQRQKESEIVATARGTYAGQPVRGQFTGGALLAIRSKSNPYPVDLHLENGPSHVEIKGALLDPTSFGGANIRLDLAGTNMALLTPLVGFALPQTKPFALSGDLDYAAQRIRFTEIRGRIGNSDLAGEISSDPGPTRQQVTANLDSNRVDLEDFAGLLGTNPAGPPAPPNAPLFSSKPIDLPALRFADFDVKYRGKRIEGRFQPLDDVAADLTMKDGAISLHPLSFGVGQGHIEGTIALTPRGKLMVARADVDFRQVDFARMMAATHTFSGFGLIGGRAEIEGAGDSVAGILGGADGEVKLFMTGGDISALLVNLSSLDFATSLLSALGVPQKTPIRCMVTDLPISRGDVDLRTVLLDTDAANVTGHGSVNLRTETLNISLNTEAKHFSIGSLHGPIEIGGHLRSPAIRPGAETVARAGLAAGLGALLTPLGALLPTIQLGLGKNNDCNALVRTAEQPPQR